MSNIDPNSPNTSFLPSLQNSPTHTKEKAKKTFMGLKKNFWMQIIDGKYHKHGQWVFDYGYHTGRQEPGFFSSLVNGCKYAYDHLTEKLSIEFYKDLHRHLCEHFQGPENNTQITKDETGKFREDSVVWFKEFAEEVDEAKINELNNDLAKICKNLSVPQFITFSKNNRILVLDYHKISIEEQTKIIEKLFDNYNQKISQINSKLTKTIVDKDVKELMLEKIDAIAELFQILEWLHPLPDGQGRTDLVLLAKLLSEEGLNPAILTEPYMSSWSSFSEWKEYLIQGMDLWQKERTKS